MVKAPSAYALLKEARERVYTLPEDFPGFRAQLAFYWEGVWHHGALEVEGFTPRVRLMEGVQSLAERELASLLAHRKPLPFNQGEGQYPMRLLEETPLGALIALEDPYRSRIWVREGRLQAIERHLGQGGFRIHLLDWVAAGERLLPHRFILTWRDNRDKLIRLEVFEDHYRTIGSYWLPVQREVRVEHENGLQLMVLKLEEVEV